MISGTWLFLWLNCWFGISLFIASFFCYWGTQDHLRGSEKQFKLNRKWDELIAAKRQEENRINKQKKLDKCLDDLSSIIKRASTELEENKRKDEKGLAEAIEKAKKFLDEQKKMRGRK